MRRSFFSGFMFATSMWCAGCVVFPEEPKKLADGARCEQSDQCKSGQCTTDALCAPSSCDCPGDTCSASGERSSDCASNEMCVLSTNVVEDIGQFFSGDNDNDGYCQLPCSVGCPEHFSCKGQYCAAQQGWTDPVPSVTWSGGAEGMLSGNGAQQMVPLAHDVQVTLTASATSPLGRSIKPFDWVLVDDSGMQAESTGSSVDLTIEPGGTFRRAELFVHDEKMRSASLTVIFEACGAQGEACNYQGSGCCSSCDDATNLCQ